MWSQIHHCGGLFQNRQWHTHTDYLFVDPLWRDLRLRTTVFAGVAKLSHNWFSFRSQLFFVLLFDLSVNHLRVLLHGETQVAPTFIVEDILLLVLGPEPC